MKWKWCIGLVLTLSLAACDGGGGDTPSTGDGGVPLDGDVSDGGRLDGRPTPDGGTGDDGVADDMMPTVDGGEDGDALLPDAGLDGDVPDGDLPDGGAPDGDVPDGDLPDGEPPPDMMARCGELNPCPPLPDGRPQRCDENTGMCVEDEPPAAEAFEVRVPEDGEVALTLRGSDAADQPLTYEVVEAPARGRLEGEPPELTYIPEPDAFGADQFTYVAIDAPSGQRSVPAQVSVTIDPVNDPPVIENQAPVRTDEDTPRAVVLADLVVTDDGPIEALVVEVLPGERYAAEGATFSPEADYFGALQVNVRVVDGEGAPSQPFPLMAQVDAVNDPPRIVGTSPLTTPEDTAITPTLDDVQVVDDAGPDGISLRLLPGDGYTIEAGAVVPAPDFNGDLRVGVVAVDADGAESAPAELTITVTPVNDPPRVTGLDPSPVTVVEDQPLTVEARFFVLEDEDVPGLVFEVQAGPNYSVDAEGRVQPDADFTGELQVTVVVVDADGLRSDPVVLPVQVLPVGDPPVIDGQVSPVATPEETPYTITVADLNVSDVDSDPALFTVRALPGENYAVDGAQITPALDFNGRLTVPVVVADGVADSEPFDFLVDVTPVNDAPRITGPDAAVDAREDTPIRVGVGAVLIEDPDSEVFQLEVLPGDGYQVDAQGLAVPEPDLNGPVTVNVRVLDDQEAASEPFGLVVQVAPVNDPPSVPGVAIDDLVAHAPFVAPAGALLEGATDVEGGLLTVVPQDAGTAAGGRVVVTADGGFSYTGPVGALGEDSFPYVVRDAEGGVTEATARLELAHRVWFVESLAVGRGRLEDPFGTLEGAFATAEAGDYVYITSGLSELNLLQAARIPEGVQVVGEGAGLTLGRNLDLPAGAHPTVVGAPDLFILSSNVQVRGLRIVAEHLAFIGDQVGNVVLEDLVVGPGFGELLRAQELSGPLTLAGWRSEPMARAGGGLSILRGVEAATLTLRDLDLRVLGNGLFVSGIPTVSARDVSLDSSGGAAVELNDVPDLDYQGGRLTSVGSFGPGISLVNVTGRFQADEANLNEASEGGLLVQDGAPVVTLTALNTTGGFNGVRFNAPNGQLTVGAPGDVAAMTTAFAGESAIWARAGDITVHGLRASQILGSGIQVPGGADLAQLTVNDAQFDEVEGHALLVGDDGEAFEPTTVRSATLSGWVVNSPRRAPIHLNGVDQTTLTVDGLRAEDFAPDVDGIIGWGAGTITLNDLVLRGQAGAADGVRLVGDGELTVRVVRGEFTSAAGDNAVRLVGDGRPATVDFAVLGAQITGWLGDRISLDAGDGDTNATLRADDNTVTAGDPPGFGVGIRLQLEADQPAATLTGRISAQGNVVTGVSNHAIDVTLRDAAANTADVWLIGNQIAQIGGEALRLRALDGAQVRAAIRENTAGAVGGGGLLIVSDDPAQVAVEGEGEDAAATLDTQNNVAPVAVPGGVRVIPVGSLDP